MSQCTAMITTYQPFIMGGDVNQTKQCEAPEEVIVTEISSGEQMPLCKSCLIKFQEHNEGDEALYNIKEVT